jgi:hypothetical protein
MRHGRFREARYMMRAVKAYPGSRYALKTFNYRLRIEAGIVAAMVGRAGAAGRIGGT